MSVFATSGPYLPFADGRDFPMHLPESRYWCHRIYADRSKDWSAEKLMPLGVISAPLTDPGERWVG